MRTITRSLPDWADVWCIQPPGKEGRGAEPQLDDCRIIARRFFNAVSAELSNGDTPLVLFGHSVGSWLLWEFLKVLDTNDMPMPKMVFVSTFPSPAITAKQSAVQVPWKANRGAALISLEQA